MKTSADYHNQAEEFLTKTGVKMEVKYLRNDLYFDGDKDKRDIYQVTFSRGKRSFNLTFGNSIHSSGKWWKYGKYQDGVSNTNHAPLPRYNWEANPSYATPDSYSVLACITKSDPGTFKDFCADFGYDEDSRSAERIYKAVCEEWKNVQTLWTDAEIEEMQEIS